MSADQELASTGASLAAGVAGAVLLGAGSAVAWFAKRGAKAAEANQAPPNETE